MREIKFRARNKELGCWMFWTIPTEENETESLARDIFFSTADLKTLTEYVGLHDKNGKEIYEGDITCRHWDNGTWQNGVIIYDEVSFLWKEIGGNEKHGLGFIHPIGINTKHSEVIGNIWENPELLRKVTNGRKAAA